MVNKDIVKEDFIFAEEKLYYRKKIIFFEPENIDALCFYFRKNDSFFVSFYLDFLEIDNVDTLIKIKRILEKDKILLEDVAELILIFGNYEGELSVENSLVIANKIFGLLNLDEIYFSV